MKNKIIISSILTIAMCVSLIAGSTFALFTSEDSVNIAVTSGKIEVVAKVDAATLTTSSLGVAQTAGAFANGGSATLSGDTLKLDKLTPGDKATFSITVENKSNVAMNYRFVWSVAGELASYLTATVNGKALTNNSTAWALWDTANGNTQTFAVVVELLDSVGNDAQGKAADISFKVEAVQGNTVPVKSFEELMANKSEGGSYTLTSDIETTGAIKFADGTDNTINLGGHTVTIPEDKWALGVQAGGSLVIDGEGTIDCGKGLYVNKNGATVTVNNGTINATETTTLNGIAFHSLAQNNAHIVINGGTFTSDTEDACLFFVTSNSTLEINGGFFENTADKTPDLLSMGTNKGNTNRIILKGGTFVNWNPLEDKMCYTGKWPSNGYEAFVGPFMIIWEGYTVISETQANGDVWYMVVPVSE